MTDKLSCACPDHATHQTFLDGIAGRAEITWTPTDLAAVRDAAERLREACEARRGDAQTASAPARIDGAASAGVGARERIADGVESDSGGRDG